MKPRTFDAIVVGLGAHGSAALSHLARRGSNVLGIEQFGIGHNLGSSHGSSRIFRLAYFEHPNYVPLLRRSLALWTALEKQSKRTLLCRTGGIYLGRPDHPELLAGIASAEQHDIPHRILKSSELKRRYPQFKLPRNHIAMHEPTAAVLLPERCISAHIESALRAGAHIRTHEPVTSWESHSRGVIVRTATAEYRAKKLVLSAGAWMQTLTDLKLNVTRQLMAWVWPKKPELFAAPRFCIWAHHNDDGSLQYGFPMLPETSDMPGLKVALHRREQVTTADTINRTAQPEEVAHVREFLKRHVPLADGELLAIRVCMYTNSPDSHLTLGFHPEHSNVIIASPCSGHGFKFAPVIGEAIADLALKGKTKLPIDFLAPTRPAIG